MQNINSDAIKEFVVSTIAELVHCERDIVLAATSLLAIGVDSLSISTLVTFVEAEYGCTFTVSQLMDLYAAIDLDKVVGAVAEAVQTAAGEHSLSSADAL